MKRALSRIDGIHNLLFLCDPWHVSLAVVGDEKSSREREDFFFKKEYFRTILIDYYHHSPTPYHP